ncbi:MAG: LysR family transcriptional regulator [Faecousia sp.]
MNINCEHYRVFYYVAKLKSFTQAANALMNSQPNISRTIKILEHELGCALFARSNRQVLLTAEGEVLYRHVSAAFEQLQAGEEEIQFGKGLEGGVLRIAATEVALRTILLPVLKGFRALYPGVHIKLINSSTTVAIEELQNGLADLAVVTTPADITEKIRKTTISAVREAAVCGDAYAHLAQAPITLAELIQAPIISLGEQTGTFRFYTQLFADHGVVFEPDIEAATADQILPMVKANLGIGFVSEVFLQEEELGKTVFKLELKEEIPLRSVCLLMPAAHPSGPAAKALEKALIDAAKRTEA